MLHDYFLSVKPKKMPRVSKRLTLMKKLEDRVEKLKKSCIASLSADDDFLEPDDYLCALCVVSYRKLKIVTNKRCLFRSCKCRKHKGGCPYDKDFFAHEDIPWLNESDFYLRAECQGKHAC